MRIKLVGCNGRFTHSTLSLFYLRQCLVTKCPDADISLCQQTINDSYYEALLTLTDNDPDIICFSVYIWNHTRIKRFINDLAEARPETQIIIGGPEADQLQDIPHPRLCLAIGEIEGIDPQFYQDIESGSLKKQYEPDEKPDFKSPYTETDFSEHLANRHIYYESSRGCPYQCSYCLSSTEKNLRHLPTPQVIEELATILAHRPKIIRFIDRTFNAIPTRTIEIWKHILSLDTESHFHFEISPDIFTPEMFELLGKVKGNRFQFEIGLQSTNPATLRAVNRKTDIATALANIRKLVELDTIHLHVDLILGLPHETYESYRQSFNDVFELGCHYIQMGLLKLLPNTPITFDHKELQGSSHPPYELLHTPYLSHDQLKELYWFGECVEKFHNTHFFKPFFSYLRAQEENGFDFFIHLLHLCQQHHFFEKASTQKLMSQMLALACEDREDRTQCLELLQFSWLYSGMRKLPDHLPPLAMEELKASLYAALPQNLPPHFTHTDRNLFFRQAEFGLFSQQTIQAVHPSIKAPQVVCFLPPPIKQETIFKQARLILFDPCSKRTSGKPVNIA